MKILSIGNFGTSWDGSICDELHIANALENLGHEVFRHQREEILDSLPLSLAFADFALIAQWDGYTEEFINRLKQLAPKLVYWAFDYQADGQEWHKKLIEQSDLYLSKRLADSKYSNWRWLSQDFAPLFLEPYNSQILGVDKKRDIDVLFTGSYLPWATERNETLKAIDDKFNLEIHSVNEWPKEFKNVQGSVMDTALPELISRAKVNISIDHTIEAGYWSDRNSQIMACGGVILFHYVPLSEAVFRDHVFYFYNTEDCLEKLERMLKLSDRDLDELGERNYQYAQRYLVVHNRVQDMLTIVGSIL